MATRISERQRSLFLLPMWSVVILALVLVHGTPSHAVSESDTVSAALSVPASDESDPCFRWAFGAMASSGNGMKLVPITQSTVLRTGDKFKMMVELHKKCFVYVVYQSSKGEISMLFPYSIEQFNKDYEASRRYFIPHRDTWFQLDEHVGTETFYLLAAHERLAEVEYLFKQYVAADPEKKSEIAGQMMAEVRNVGKNREYAATIVPAFPGATRGIERALGQDPSDISSISDDIGFTESFSRAYSIQHR